ncbi:MAG: cytochrome-c peroxidase [Chitinophagales bacterium]
MKQCYLLSIFCLVLACNSETIQENEPTPLEFPELMELPMGFPAVEFPEGNEWTQDRWALGKKLFFEPMLSVDTSVSCASCHHPNLAFSDDVAFSLGVEQRIGTRNAPSLANVAYHPYFTREGGVPTLEMQVFVPIQEHNEFDFNIVLLSERLSQDSGYVSMANTAYNRQPDPFVITRALACFERSLLSGNSAYDQYINGDVTALSDAVVRGEVLFFSEKTQCATCHSGFNFTNYAFENNGLYEFYPDDGRFRLTGDEADRALFKVPSLRNVALSAPYMHDGSMTSLSEVVEHYVRGGANHPHKNEVIQGFALTENEKNDLIAFLESLTDEAFVNNPLFRND